MDNYQYIEKELSWLSFNHRVLQEAQDSTVPLLERLRFLGIYSSNMDEFYRVRVANVRRTVLLSKNKFEKKQAVILFEKIQDKVIQLQREFDETYIFLLRELADNDIGIKLLNTGRVDAWVVDEIYIENLPQEIQSLLDVHPLIINRDPIYYAFSKANFDEVRIKELQEAYIKLSQSPEFIEFSKIYLN